MPEVVYVENRRNTAMEIATGLGTREKLRPGFKGEILGNYDFLRKTQRSVGGLVVKETSKHREDEDPVTTLMEMELTNLRKIPVDLVISQGSRTHLRPGETKLVRGNRSLINKFPGIKISVIRPELTEKEVEEMNDLVPSALETFGSYEEAVVATADTSLAHKLNLPPTVERFETKAESMSIYDLRAIGEQLGIKGRDKHTLISKIIEKVYA